MPETSKNFTLCFDTVAFFGFSAIIFGVDKALKKRQVPAQGEDQERGSFAGRSLSERAANSLFQ
jgi:hypothetical protein